MTGREREVLDTLVRQDLTSFTQKAFTEVSPGDRFADNWHIDCLCWHLEKCYRGEITRLIITLPPRYLKSICASVAFPAWVLGQDPTSMRSTPARSWKPLGTSASSVGRASTRASAPRPS